VVDDKLVPIGGNVDTPMEDASGENIVTLQAKSELSFEEILEPL